MPLTKLYKCCFCLRIHDNNYIDNITNLSVSLPLEESDCEKRGTLPPPPPDDNSS